MLIYADGTALCRVLSADPEAASWLRWSHENADRLVTSPLALGELRRAAAPRDVVARDRARDVADSVTVVRFSDQALEKASVAAAVLSPFQALHLGIAVADPDIEALATYDRVLARVAEIYAVPVVTPGRPDRWWDA